MPPRSSLIHSALIKEHAYSKDSVYALLDRQDYALRRLLASPNAHREQRSQPAPLKSPSSTKNSSVAYSYEPAKTQLFSKKRVYPEKYNEILVGNTYNSYKLKNLVGEALVVLIRLDVETG
jgi:hypothetical protein